MQSISVVLKNTNKTHLLNNLKTVKISQKGTEERRDTTSDTEFQHRKIT